MANYGLHYDTDHFTDTELPSPDGPEDPEALLNIWLDELDTLTSVSFRVNDIRWTIFQFYFSTSNLR